jgi:type IV secretory pathway VirB4 component
MASGNGMILGVTGGGKSFAAKQEMINVLLRDPDAQVFVIDPDREYAALTKALGGRYIHISPDSAEHLNPMDISAAYGDDEDPTKLKSSFITSLCSTLVHGYLTPQQKSLIDRACLTCYRKFFAAGGKHEMPTLKDFYSVLKSYPEPEAQQIALALESYIEGSLSAFASPTNVVTDARIVAYDIRDLGNELKTLGMLVVLDQIWNALTRNRDERKRTYVLDSGHIGTRHVGIVVSCDGSIIEYIDGNNGGRVCRSHVSVNHSNILGFGTQFSGQY